MRLLCLANSIREGKRCVAGIDADTGEWIRPVPPGGGPIPGWKTLINRRYITPLDILRMEVARPRSPTPYQRENREVCGWNWEIVGRAAPRDLLPYRTRKSHILHNRRRVVEPSFLERLKPGMWQSLELVHVRGLRFVSVENRRNPWQAVFSFGRQTQYQLPVTDPVVVKRLNYGEKIADECLLTVSLTEPIEFPKFGLPKLCYKLVAAVIELTGASPPSDPPVANRRNRW